MTSGVDSNPADQTPPGAWLEVRIVTTLAGGDAVAEAIHSLAAGGVVQEQLGDPHDLRPDALLPDVHVKLYRLAADDTPEFRRLLRALVAGVAANLAGLAPVGEPTFHYLGETDWATAWKVHYRPFRVGQRLWIEPSWWATEADTASGRQPGDLVLVLDPGMAFGTGLHQTTQLCVEALEKLVKSGARVLDVGTGSGILALAALKLGAGRVLATDNDPVATRAAAQNAALNGLADRLEVQLGTLAEVERGAWDVVVVNILAPVIEQLLREADLLRYTTGWLVLSGIVTSQLASISTAIGDAGGELVAVEQRDDWLCLWARPAVA